MRRKRKVNIIIYVVCILLGLLSIMPFWIMIVNATRSTYQIQQHAVSLIPSTFFAKKENYTMPIMVSLLKGDIYKTEYGAVYLALTLSVLPLFVVYFVLSKYIIAGVALGSVKE